MDGTTEIRNSRNRVYVPIGPTETIRNRLNMNLHAFSLALGFSDGAYSTMAKEGKILKTGALAAEALMRRQAANGESADHILMVCIVKGAPLMFDITNSVKEATIDGTVYYMVPKTSGRS